MRILGIQVDAVMRVFTHNLADIRSDGWRHASRLFVADTKAGGERRYRGENQSCRKISRENKRIRNITRENKKEAFGQD